jgi:hypothetical protein
MGKAGFHHLVFFRVGFTEPRSYLTDQSIFGVSQTCRAEVVIHAGDRHTYEHTTKIRISQGNSLFFGLVMIL